MLACSSESVLLVLMGVADDDDRSRNVGNCRGRPRLGRIRRVTVGEELVGEEIGVCLHGRVDRLHLLGRETPLVMEPCIDSWNTVLIASSGSVSPSRSMVIGSVSGLYSPKSSLSTSPNTTVTPSRPQASAIAVGQILEAIELLRGPGDVSPVRVQVAGSTRAIFRVATFRGALVAVPDATPWTPSRPQLAIYCLGSRPRGGRPPLSRLATQRSIHAMFASSSSRRRTGLLEGMHQILFDAGSKSRVLQRFDRGGRRRCRRTRPPHHRRSTLTSPAARRSFKGDALDQASSRAFGTELIETRVFGMRWSVTESGLISFTGAPSSQRIAIFARSDDRWRRLTLLILSRPQH